IALATDHAALEVDPRARGNGLTWLDRAAHHCIGITQADGGQLAALWLAQRDGATLELARAIAGHRYHGLCVELLLRRLEQELEIDELELAVVDLEQGSFLALRCQRQHRLEAQRWPNGHIEFFLLQDQRIESQFAIDLDEDDVAWL